MGTINVKSASQVAQEKYEATFSGAIRAIDQAADEARKKLITAITAQPETYREKWLEVLEYRETSAEGEYLTAEATRRGLTVEALVQEIEATRAQWTTVNAGVEAERVGGKDDVRDAADVAGIEAAREDAVASIWSKVPA